MTRELPRQDSYDEFARFYDMSDLDRKAEISFYKSLAREEDRSVLELGCGTGTIVAAVGYELAIRHGSEFRVVGVDRSAKMLEIARCRHAGMEWVQGDMIQPPVQGGFDLVLCAFNTLQLLESHAAVLQTFRAVSTLLNPRGIFVFDLYNAAYSEPSSASAATAAVRRNRIVRSFKDANGQMLEVREDAIEDPGGESVLLDWRVMNTSSVPATQLARLELRLQHYSPAAIEDLLRAAELRIQDRYGDVRKAPFTPNGSKKQVVICRQ